MSHWQKIRKTADDLRLAVLAARGMDASRLRKVDEVAGAVVEHLGLFCVPEHPDSANLRGALAVLEDDCIYFNNTLPEWFRSFCIAHEAAHFVLHRRSIECTREQLEDFSGDETATRSAEAAVGYGAGERREREANLFALELLLPTSCSRRAFVDEELTADHISTAVGIPVHVIAGQLARAVLLPAFVDDGPSKEAREPDVSQRAAAESEECPALVSAGPGTGKTQTLTERIRFLLRQGDDPQSVLALTFSNKAAAEMRDRVVATEGAAASRLQIMTFHAFGLDLLRRYWNEAGLEPHSPLLDRFDAVLQLESRLSELKLEHYRNLHEPTLNLSPILSAIARAKDELCSPERYRELAEHMLAGAADGADKLKAEKALEVARVYQLYETHLRANKQIDFGDLIYLSVKLLQGNAAVRSEVRSRYRHILVDEFQDVNRACGVLLREVAGEGENLWVVGDLRQSIYRWRGASPANIRMFGEDYPNAKTRSLEVNYRSSAEIVELFSEFAVAMSAGGREQFCEWSANRGTISDEVGPPATLTVASDPEAEAAAIAERIRGHVEAGGKFREHAVICRTHKQLGKLARSLSERRLPIFYLGDLFEREEVRDMLALLDLTHDSDGYGLIRVARFPEYDIPLADAVEVVHRIEKGELEPRSAIQASIEAGAISEQGRCGLAKLYEHLRSEGLSAWEFLIDYLFVKSQYLKNFVAAETVDDQARLLAIYQFLRSAESISDRVVGDDRIAAFLRHVRAMAWFGEDRNYAQMPEAAGSLDAVRLLTVHSCKGLEFPVVHLPYLGDGQFPLNDRTNTCPDPAGLAPGSDEGHDEEEECLFFVAMSRARDRLHLYRAERYGSRASQPSRFLTNLTGLPAPAIALREATEQIVSSAPMDTAPADGIYYASDLDAYIRCPKQYYYSRILGLRREDERSAFLKFHTCVNATIRSLQATPVSEQAELTEALASERLEMHWAELGIDDHPYSQIYKEIATELVARALPLLNRSAQSQSDLRMDVGLDNGTVRVKVDALDEVRDRPGTLVITRFKTGRSPAKEDPDDAEALAVRAVRRDNPDSEVILRKIYLSDNGVTESNVSERVIANRTNKYNQAIAMIGEGRFDAKVNDRNCPHCSYYFICPSEG